MTNGKKGLAFLFVSAGILFIASADGIRFAPQSTTSSHIKPSLKRLKKLEYKIKLTEKRCARATLIPKKECYAELAKLNRQLIILRQYYPERR